MENDDSSNSRKLDSEFPQLPSRSYAASFGSNTPSPVTMQRRSVDQANATTESLLSNSTPKTDEDVVIIDALEGPRSRARSSPKSPGSGIGNLIGASGSNLSPASGGSNQRTPTGGHLLNPRAHEYTPHRFAHSEQELRSGISNLNRTEIRRLGGSSGGPSLPPSPTIYPSFLSSPIPNPYLRSPLPSPTNIYYRPRSVNSPRTPNYPMEPPPPQSPLQVRPTPETTPHRPTTSTAKGKSPVTLNPPSEPEPSLDECTSDATMDLPSAAITIQTPLYSDWVPLDDGIECTLLSGLTRNETRISALLSADSTLPSAGSTQNETRSTLPSGSTQNENPDCNLPCASTQNQSFSREELDEYMNRVLYEMRSRKRLPVFENITKFENKD